MHLTTAVAGGAIFREPEIAPPATSVPFHRPTRTEREVRYVADALDRAAAGESEHYIESCERLLERALGVHRAMLVTSCTHALEASALLLDLAAGDEVIVPSFTFVSCVNAIVLRGARPVFADIRADSLTLDLASVERLITPRTKAIMLVDYAGFSPDAEAFAALAAQRGLTLIEDNAPGLFARHNGRSLGTFGALATVSFDAAKNITCGAGGALLINDPAFAARAEIIREKGTDRAGFRRGEVDTYTWRDVGSNYVIADVLAAQLLAQLEDRDAILRKRGALWQRYDDRLSAWAAARGVRLPYVPAGADQVYHAYALMMPSARARDRFLGRLGAAGIGAVTHYTPLHRSPAAVHRGFTSACPVTDEVCSTIVRLPLFTQMSQAEHDRVVDAVLHADP